MAFSTPAQVRASTDKLLNETDVTALTLTGRIAEADKIIIVDLSSLYSQSQLEDLGSANLTLNLLSVYKSVELTLSKLYGAARQADEISDIDYWRKMYDALLKKIMNGEISLTGGTTVPVDIPVMTPSRYRKKLFPYKGLVGIEEGRVTDGEK